jgi:hypothetical protein
VRLNRFPDQSPVPAFWRAILLCGLATTLLRFPTLLRSVLDWDESLYVLVAGQVLSGHLPYTTVWDNKPPGIYVIFAVFEALCRDPVLAIRAATIVFTTALAGLLWRLAFIICAGAPAAAQPRLAWLAALSFIVGALSNDGLAANTELFMECFSVAAILAAIDPGFCAGRPAGRAFCTGVLFSLACLTKYVAVFEAQAVGFALLFCAHLSWRDRMARGAIAVAGAALAPACIVLIYAAAGDLGLWWSCSIASNITRVAVPFSGAQLQSVALTILPRWAPAILAACLLLVTLPIRGGSLAPPGFSFARRAQALLALWLVGGTLGVISAKSFYDHYFLQILPPACLALAFMAARFAPALLATPRRAAGLIAALLLIPGVAGYDALAAIMQPLETTGDTPRQIATLLRPQITAGASLYVFDGQPIIYALTGAAPPTRYVLPSVLIRCFLAGVAGVNATREVGHILATNPKYIIRASRPVSTPNVTVYAELTADLAARYELWRSFGEEDVYRLRQGAPPLRPFTIPDSCTPPA